MSWSFGLRVPDSPWWDGGLLQVSHVSLTDRVLCPARCRRTSNSVPTCTHVAEPLLEVAGIEQAEDANAKSGVGAIYGL